MESRKRRIVVLGAGFAGLTFCQTFNHPDAEVILIDRQNHHLFQPLLYQVATAGLSAPEIAQPIRGILSDEEAVTVLLEQVKDIRLGSREVELEKQVIGYDYLVMGLGGATSYFGHPEWAEFAPGLKSLDDALHIRRHVLWAFEKAETATSAEERERLMTIVVVGGGPTGVELAGAFAELARHVLRCDFRRIDPAQARVILIEASPVVLSHLPAGLAESAQRQLADLGVEIRTNTRVTALREKVVETTSGTIHAENIIWAAGVAANPLTRKLGVELDRAGRVKVAPDLSVPGYPEAFAIGDMAYLVDAKGVLVPGVSPAAMQMAEHVAEMIREELNSPAARERRMPFVYWDKGTMATIGRSRAVAKIKDFEFTGFPAWMAWLGVHLLFLIGFRNKIAVVLQWVYSYFTYKRGSRIITGLEEEKKNRVIEATKPAIPVAVQKV
ncbi:MAG: NAD(P)/FAD-dependent oxidoreductase [Verrucomicrobiota bacterium]|nr:NAD(P)/FAD-dependent oxidoreductase [Verrucomicrobiota bacterium]